MSCLFEYSGLKLAVEKLNIIRVYMTLLFGIKDSWIKVFFSQEFFTDHGTAYSLFVFANVNDKNINVSDAEQTPFIAITRDYRRLSAQWTRRRYFLCRGHHSTKSFDTRTHCIDILSVSQASPTTDRLIVCYILPLHNDICLIACRTLYRPVGRGHC
jgi:hypothetical protein